MPKTPNFTWITVINTPNKSQKLNFKSTEFLQSASALNNAPADFGCEVAFAGRSNAGKSSAINALTSNSKLARTSRTPGRTQLINFFTVADQIRLVDLPGYGFAKVPLKVKEEWNKQLERYLQLPAQPEGANSINGYPTSSQGLRSADDRMGGGERDARTYLADEVRQAQTRACKNRTSWR